MAKHLLGLHSFKKQFIDIIRQLSYKHQIWQVWRDFVTMAATSIANAVHKTHFDYRENIYMETIKRYDAKEQQGFVELFAIVVNALENNPEQDFLGELFMALELGSHWKGQFFTPYHVCNLMAEIQCVDLKGNLEEKKHISVNDPACGAGALMIAFANAAKKQDINYQQDILFVAQDIDPTAAMMCYIQLSLLGCAGYIIVRDTLSRPPIDPLADTSDIWYTPMYFSDVWHCRRRVDQMKDIMRTNPPRKNTELEDTETKVQIKMPENEAPISIDNEEICIQLTLF